MFIDFVWLLPDRVLVSRHTGVIGLDDVLALAQEKQPPRSSAASGLLHHVVDLSGRDGFAPEMFDMKRMYPILQQVQAGTDDGWSIVIDPNPNRLVGFILTVVTQLVNIRMHVVPDVEAALRFLAERDPHIAAGLGSVQPYTSPAGLRSA